MTSANRAAASRLFGLAGCLFALFTVPAVRAQNPVPPKWKPAVVVTAGYGEHTGGNNGSQAVTVYLSRPDRYWTFSAGHQRLLGEEGYGAGVNFQRAWSGKYRLGGGVSSGTNRRGGLYPRYHLGVFAGVDVLAPLQLSVNYSRRRSAVNESHSDRFGTGFTWYAPGPWILGGSVTYGVSQPGSRTSWSSGGGLTYSVWERWSAGVRVDYGDGSYMLLPTQDVVQFQSWAYAASVSKYLAPKLSVRVTAGHTDYYGGFNLTFAVAKGW